MTNTPAQKASPTLRSIFAAHATANNEALYQAVKLYVEMELLAASRDNEDAENACADKLLAELSRRGVNTENWDGDEGLWPTLAKCIVSYVSQKSEEMAEAHRMQLAAISVAATCNTEDSAKKQTIGIYNPYWTAAYGDVFYAVSREVKERQRAEQAEQEASVWQKRCVVVSNDHALLKEQLREAQADRDRLWCKAIVATQDSATGRLVCDVETLLKHFNASRDASEQAGEPR